MKLSFSARAMRLIIPRQPQFYIQTFAVKLLFKYFAAISKPNSRWGQLGSLALVMCTFCWTQPATAEGSKELTASGGDRPYLEFRTALTAGVQRRTIIKVYANSGETINLGSSAAGVGLGRINYRSPSGTAGSCTLPTTANNNPGKILNRTQEIAGPLLNAGGYTPCIVTVPAGQSGVWEIDFVSPNSGSATDPTPISATGNWTQIDNVGFVAAWDVTVRNSSGTAIPGRTYANYLALNMGANSRLLSSQLFIQTVDGYRYRVDLNGLDPFGFIFFANKGGFRSTTTGSSLFKSILLSDIPGSATFQNPGAPDSGTRVTHKIFFNSPNSDLPSSALTPNGSTWLLLPPAAPPTPTNFRFTGQEGTAGQASPSLGGNFRFDAPEVATYSLTLDLNQDGVYGNVNDRTFVGTSVVGTNTVFWDGKDGNGIVAPASSSAYNVQITLLTGDVHFPFIDAENNPSGFIIQRETLPGSDSFNLYYNDTGLTGGTPPNPISALGGVNSSSGAQRFTNLFGDVKGIDSWTYVPSTPTLVNGGVTLASADLAISKTDNQTTINAGSPITYTITVTNNGPSNVTGAAVSDSIPNTIAGVRWTCAVTTGTGSCGAASGTGNTINTTVNLNNGAIGTYTVTGTLSPTASGTLSNTATVTRPNDQNDSNTANNTATDTTTINSPSRLRLVKRITAINSVNLTGFVNDLSDVNDDPGVNWPTGYLRGAIAQVVQPKDVVEYTIYFLSDGGNDTTNVQICDLVPANTTFLGITFNGSSPTDGGLPGTDLGMALALSSTTPTAYLTNVSDTPDRGQFFAPGTSAPAACNTSFTTPIPGSSNISGAVVVDVVKSPTTLPRATALVITHIFVRTPTIPIL